jgi:hypothetical protein
MIMRCLLILSEGITQNPWPDCGIFYQITKEAGKPYNISGLPKGLYLIVV